jgi:hypothetical protein
MERELWPLLYRLIQRVANDFSQKNVRYQPWVVVAVSLWATLHDLRSIQACRTDFGKALLQGRGEIERRFGTRASLGGGLAPLPAWVRRLHRVRSWIWDKLRLNAARILKNQGLTSILP